MIFKERDPADACVHRLEQALKATTDRALRQRLERDLAIARAGISGEREAAYHIDFHLKDSKNWAIIHDLRIEWNGRVAQIDHLLLNRLLEIYVIESKSFRTKVRVANGGWERLNFKHWEGIPSPVEQNERHIVVLRELLRDRKLAPTRMGLNPRLLNVVVMQPSCSIIGDMPKDASVYRMDVLVKRLLDINPSALDVFRAISQETLHMFAKALVDCHTPALTTVSLSNQAPASTSARSVATAECCHSCQGPMSKAEASYCRSKSKIFGGLLLCRKCQAYCPKFTAIKTQASTCQSPEVPAALCAVCSSAVDRKVVAFCRFNYRKFAGRILCRTCQVTVGSPSATPLAAARTR